MATTRDLVQRLQQFFNTEVVNENARVAGDELQVIFDWLTADRFTGFRFISCLKTLVYRPYVYDALKRNISFIRTDRSDIDPSTGQARKTIVRRLAVVPDGFPLACEYTFYVVRYMLERQSINRFPLSSTNLELSLERNDSGELDGAPLTFVVRYTRSGELFTKARIDINRRAIVLVESNVGQLQEPPSNDLVNEPVLLVGDDFKDMETLMFTSPSTREFEQWLSTRNLRNDVKQVYAKGEQAVVDNRREDIDQLVTSALFANLFFGTTFDVDQSLQARVNRLNERKYIVNTRSRRFSTNTLELFRGLKATSNRGENWPTGEELANFLFRGKRTLDTDTPGVVRELLTDEPHDFRRISRLLQLWQDPFLVVQEDDDTSENHRLNIASSLINLTTFRLPRGFKNTPRSFGSVTTPFFQWLAGIAEFPSKQFVELFPVPSESSDDQQKGNDEEKGDGDDDDDEEKGDDDDEEKKNGDGVTVQVFPPLNQPEVIFIKKSAPWSTYLETLLDLPTRANLAAERDPKSNIPPLNARERFPWVLSLERIPELQNRVAFMLYYKLDAGSNDQDTIFGEALDLFNNDVVENEVHDEVQAIVRNRNNDETGDQSFRQVCNIQPRDETVFATEPFTYKIREFVPQTNVEPFQSQFSIAPKNVAEKQITVNKGFRNPLWPRIWLACNVRVTTGRRLPGQRDADAKKRKRRTAADATKADGDDDDDDGDDGDDADDESRAVQRPTVPQQSTRSQGSSSSDTSDVVRAPDTDNKDDVPMAPSSPPASSSDTQERTPFRPVIISAQEHARYLKHAPIDSGLCDMCGQEAFHACSDCKQVFYCSVECQQDAWQSHSTHCHLLDPERMASNIILRIKFSAKHLK